MLRTTRPGDTLEWPEDRPKITIERETLAALTAAILKIGNVRAFLAGWRLSEPCRRNEMEREVGKWVEGCDDLFESYDILRAALAAQPPRGVTCTMTDEPCARGCGLACSLQMEALAAQPDDKTGDGLPPLRAAFEAWMSDDGKYPKAVERDSSGAYRLMQTATNWTAWQAADAAAVARERERCALMCEGIAADDKTGYGIAEDCAAAIRKGD